MPKAHEVEIKWRCRVLVDDNEASPEAAAREIASQVLLEELNEHDTCFGTYTVTRIY